jgi:hypothetical protein
LTKKKLLIAGSSHTFGLGLELQHSERFNNIEFLKKNGVILPIELYPEDEEIWDKYKWSTLLREELNLEEININLPKHSENYWSNGTVIDTLLKFLYTDIEETHDIEMCIVQPYLHRLEYVDESLNKLIMLTPTEMLNILKNKKSNPELIKKIENFLDEYDEDKKFLDFISLFKSVVDKHKHIKFYILLWYEGLSIIKKYKNYKLFSKFIEPHLLKFYDDNRKLTSPFHLLENKKMLIKDNAFCYTNQFDENKNKRWEVGKEKDKHASSEGQELIFKQILNNINKNNLI